MRIVCTFVIILGLVSSLHSNTQKTELYRIKIKNTKHGPIVISKNKGKTWQKIGEVLIPSGHNNRQGYTASKWGKTSSIVASAVNAIHIKTGQNTEENKGIIFSIKPKEGIKEAQLELWNNDDSPNYSIYTSIPAGKKIFGGEYAPLVGNEVTERITSTAEHYLNKFEHPKIGQTFLIKVRIPKKYPVSFEFENKRNGNIYVIHTDGKKKVIGSVIKPAHGIGRFEGSEYARAGRLRANHPGVIEVATSHHRQTGGFQIIPLDHAHSPEMVSSLYRTQWMIIRLNASFTDSGQGKPPLFSDYIHPSFTTTSRNDPEWFSKMLSRALVQIKMNHGSWENIKPKTYSMYKPLPKEANTALKNMTHVRILLPVHPSLFTKKFTNINIDKTLVYK
ncbi:hypothetical protein ACFL56_02445 [Candidatus Margulisiibacteriota bacterium]